MNSNKYYWPKKLNKNQLKSIKDSKSCMKCGLWKKCLSPKMEISGEGKKGIMFIAEAPGEEEDKYGIQLIGETGKLHRNFLKRLSIDLDIDCWKDNSLICRPPQNRTPTNAEIKYCSSHIFKNIDKYKPKKIITLGMTALSSLIGDRININKMGKWVGMSIPDQDIGCWIFPAYHPSYILRNQYNKGLGTVLSNIYFNHLKNAVEWDKPFEKENINNDINIITDVEELILYLKEIEKMEYSPIAFDYETTGLKPYINDHKIVCMSIAYSKKDDVKTIVFPIFNDNSKFKLLLKKILTNRKIKKIAHNIKFEDNWTRNIFGYEIKGWYWDTMLASHCIDNRPGITGLKFQTYKEFGILGYENEIKSYLKSTKGIYDKNSLEDLSKNNLYAFNKVMLYCGIDSKYTYKLWKRQKYLYKTSLYKGYELLHNGALEFSKIEEDGILIDSDYYTKQSANLQRRLTRLENRIQNYDEIKNIWKNKTFKKFNPRSNTHMQTLLYTYLKTRKNQIFDVEEAEDESFFNSVTAGALSEINTQFTNTILQYRKLYKIRNTYLEGFMKNAANSFIHPGFLLNTVRTFRGSSSQPNFQNIPIRNAEAQKIVRKGIIPRKGNRLLEVDYSGLEVHISACYHKDPVMIKYLNDPTTDMHKDQACLLFKLNPDQITKEIRYYAKNLWVFAQFYGSYFKDCAPGLWKIINKEKTKDGILLLYHLKKNNIKSYYTFEKHLGACQHIFWYDQFNVYRKWKEKAWDDYQEKGYFDLLTGFRCSGLMKKNEVLNYRIQGTAFHCLLWSFIKLNRQARKEKWKSKIIGQIHDSLDFDIVPSELDHITPIIRKIMCEDIRKHWKWINIPLDIDAEISEIGGDWHNMSEYSI